MCKNVEGRKRNLVELLTNSPGAAPSPLVFPCIKLFTLINILFLRLRRFLALIPNMTSVFYVSLNFPGKIGIFPKN